MIDFGVNRRGNTGIVWPCCAFALPGCSRDSETSPAASMGRTQFMSSFHACALPGTEGPERAAFLRDRDKRRDLVGPGRRGFHFWRPNWRSPTSPLVYVNDMSQGARAASAGAWIKESDTT